jgi:hypothetical protein
MAALFAETVVVAVVAMVVKVGVAKVLGVVVPTALKENAMGDVVVGLPPVSAGGSAVAGAVGIAAVGTTSAVEAAAMAAVGSTLALPSAVTGAVGMA